MSRRVIESHWVMVPPPLLWLYAIAYDTTEIGLSGLNSVGIAYECRETEISDLLSV